MELLRTLLREGASRGIDFVVIGGHAMSCYGITRQTGDVDLIVCDEDRTEWRRVLETLGYKLFHEHEAFLQFSPPGIESWPVDLILVERRTFAEFRSEAREFEIGHVRIPVPALPHMIALKIHAIQQGQADRELKDLDDVVALIERSRWNARGDELRRLCEQYGSKEIHERIATILERRSGD